MGFAPMNNGFLLNEYSAAGHLLNYSDTLALIFTLTRISGYFKIRKVCINLYFISILYNEKDSIILNVD